MFYSKVLPMKTFFTSSLLAVLSAIVFGWVMVRMGGEMPSRSPDTYPPMLVEPAEPVEPETGPMPEEPSEEVPEVVLKEEVEEPDSTPAEVAPKKESTEAHGPPAPVLPFVLNVNGAEEGVSLQGSIPTKRTKEAIEKAVAKVFEEEPFENRLKFSPDTRSGLWISYLPGFLGRYFEYTGGNHEITIVDGKLILAGAVANEEAKKAVLNWTEPFQKHGLVLEESVDVDEGLKGQLAEIPEKLAAVKPAQLKNETEAVVARNEEAAEPAEEDALEVALSLPPEEAQVTEEIEDEAEAKLVFMGPFDEFYEVHTVPYQGAAEEESAEEALVAEDAEEIEIVHVSESKKTSKTPVSSEPVEDDGKPLIFYFETGSAEIAASDHEKIQLAIQRASRPRTIVYITGYSDYRGSFELNQKLALARANRVKSLIFAGDIADQVTAEVKAKGDSQSKYSTNDSDAALQHSRRVVVEVYHLK